MTNARDLGALCDYGYGANGKLLEVVSQLTPEHFTEQSRWEGLAGQPPG
jgi:hypothetical protein